MRRTSEPMVRLALGGIALTLAWNALAAPHHKTHTKHRSGKTISVAEARAAAARKEQLRQKLSRLHHHMHEVRAAIHNAKVQEHRITENIDVVQGRIDHTKRRIETVNARLDRLSEAHVQVVNRLQATQDRLATHRKLLAERLNANYERGQATYAQVLLQSRSVHELLSRGYYVRTIVHSDAELVKSVRDDMRQIEADKRELEAQAREQKALADEFESQKAQYASDLQEKQGILHQVREQRVAAEDELDDLESEANAMTDRIRALSEMLRRRRAAQQRAQAHSGHSGRAVVGDVIPPVWHGGFIRPVPGPITSGFGYRFHPILHRRKLHTGVDFGAPFGTPIHAAAGGVVILAGYTRGYGNCIIIDHGGGVTTLYGHCSSLNVSEGQAVRQGALIGHVGSTGYSTGPHLHFEVRHNGTPVPPL